MSKPPRKRSTVNQISVERARILFDYREGELFWRRTESGRRQDKLAGTYSGGKRKLRYVRINQKFYGLHYAIWNWHFGETEHAIVFRDGDNKNFRIENLMQIPKSLAYTRKDQRIILGTELLPPSPVIIDGKLMLSDLRVDCPCCMQPVANIPPNMLAINLNLSPMERRIFEAVWSGKGEPVQTERIFDRMYEDDPNGGPTPTRMYSTFKETLCDLRKKLDGSGVGIETVGYRQGYRLTLGAKRQGEGLAGTPIV